MSLFGRLRYALARGALKAAGFAVVPTWVRHSFLTPTFEALTREGYRKNAAFMACVTALAFSFPEPPLLVWDSDDDDAEKLPKHPLRQLLRRPNPRMGEDELMIYTIDYLAVGGNAYWHKVRSRGGRVVELWPYHAGQIEPIPGGPTWIERYDYDPGDGTKTPIPPEDIVHFKWPIIDLRQPWQAQPPLLQAATEVDTDNEATRYLYALLKNDAVPRTAVTVPENRYLTDDEYRRFKEDWREKYGGDRRGDVAIIEGGGKVERISLNLEELAFEALHKIPEARIAAALRVPPIVAGLNIGLERSTFANYAEAVEHFTKGTLVPLWRSVASEVEADLAPDFGGSVSVRHDLGKVQALQEDENEKWTRILSGFERGVLGLNEARAALGYGGDVPKDDYFVIAISRELVTGERLLEEAAEPPPAPVALPALQEEPDAEPEAEQGDEPPAEETRALPPPEETKARRRSATRTGRALQRIRRNVAKRMEKALDRYFEELAERVVARAQKAWPGALETKELPDASDLLSDEDDEELERLVTRYYAEVIEASWETWNAALGVEIAFDLADPAVVEALSTAGERIKEISETTRQAVIELLQHGAENGWSIDTLISGDSEHPGLRDIVEETYKGRAENIARTELGQAQNVATQKRYEDAGVTKVLILDNGQDDPDEPCRQVNGTEQTLDWFRENPLQHPRCTRAAAPILEE